MNLLVALFIIATVLIGFGLTLLLDADLNFEERVLYGVLVGVIAVSTVGFFLAWWVGMSKGTIIVSTLLSLVISGCAWKRDFRRVGREWGDFIDRLRMPIHVRGNPLPLLILLFLSAIVGIRILRIAYGTSSDGGVTVGHLSAFGDWSAHLAYTASFAYGGNWPPALPTAAGENFTYHFGIDWFAAMFIPLGASLQASLQISSAIFAVAFPGIMFVATMRFVQSRAASMIAVFVFLMAGGTAALWRFLFVDFPEQGFSIFGNLPRSYAFDGFQRNWLDNPITGFLYPQRPTMIGFAAVLMGLALFWQNRDQNNIRTYVFVGFLTGIMPIYHIFAFGVLLLMGLIWWLLERRREWFGFLFPALAFGIPTLIWQLPKQSSQGWEFPHFGWVLGKSAWDQNLGDFVWFWALNTGVFIPLVIVALVRRREFTLRFLPIFGLLLIANVGVWHFWIGNNAKYVVFFLLLGAMFVGDYLAQLIRRGGFVSFGGIVLIFSLTFAGGLDIWRAFEGSSGAYPAKYLSGDDVLVGEWARDRTPAGSVFAAANNNAHPVRVVAGRTVVSGMPGRLRDLGVDWVERDQALRTIYGVNDGFDLVIQKYQIDYVVLGPEERRLFKPVDAPADWDPARFWDYAAQVVYEIGDYKVYDVSEIKD